MKNLWLCEKGELCEIQGRNPDDKRGLKPIMPLQKGQWNAFLKHRHCKKSALEFTSATLHSNSWGRENQNCTYAIKTQE